jgi:hypothetical protein
MTPEKQEPGSGTRAPAIIELTGPEGSTAPVTAVGVLSTTHEQRVAALANCYRRALRKGQRQKAAALFDAYLIVAGIVRLDGKPRAA